MLVDVCNTLSFLSVPVRYALQFLLFFCLFFIKHEIRRLRIFSFPSPESLSLSFWGCVNYENEMCLLALIVFLNRNGRMIVDLAT